MTRHWMRLVCAIIDRQPIGDGLTSAQAQLAEGCQEFRVRAAILNPKEIPDGTTQSPRILTRFWTSFCLAPTPRRPSIRTGCLTI